MSCIMNLAISCKCGWGSRSFLVNYSSRRDRMKARLYVWLKHGTTHNSKTKSHVLPHRGKLLSLHRRSWKAGVCFSALPPPQRRGQMLCLMVNFQPQGSRESQGRCAEYLLNLCVTFSCSRELGSLVCLGCFTFCLITMDQLEDRGDE